MACSVNGTGTIYYGAQNMQKVRIEAPEAVDELLEYDTTLWVAFLWVPLFPLGTFRVRVRKWSRWRAWVPGFQQTLLVTGRPRRNRYHLAMWLAFWVAIVLFALSVPSAKDSSGTEASPGALGMVAACGWLLVLIANAIRTRLKAGTRVISTATQDPAEMRDLVATRSMLRREVADSESMERVVTAVYGPPQGTSGGPAEAPRPTQDRNKCPRCGTCLPADPGLAASVRMLTEREMTVICQVCGTAVRRQWKTKT